MSRYLLAARTAAPIVLAATGAVVLVFALLLFVNSSGFGYDFRAYDAAARRLAAGEPLYLPGTVQAYQEGRYEGLYLYPPALAVLLLPLTVLDQAGATVAWLVLRLGLFVLGCAVLPVSTRVRLATFGVGCLAFPVLFDLNIGNVSVVVFTLCAVAWRWMDRPVAAVVHALLVAVRFPFGLFGVTWLVQGRLRTLAWTIAAGLVLIAIGLPFIGVAGYGEYIGILGGLPDLSTGEHNVSFKSLALALGLPDAIVAVALPVSYLLGLAAAFVAGRFRDASTAFVVTAVATMLVTPFMHPHYLVLLLLPAALLMERGHWWAAALPLLGWLPDAVMPLIPPIAIALVLALGDRGTARTGDVAIGVRAEPAAS